LSARARIEILYGRNAVIEAMRGRRHARRLLVAEGADRQDRIASLLREADARGLAVRRLPRAEFDRIVGQVNHQGVALEASPYPYVTLDQLLRQASGRVIVVLDHLQDPQNLGTMIRTAEATQVAGLIVPDRRAASVTPAVVNSSAGAVEHVPVAMVPNLARAVEACKADGYWASALEAGPGTPSIFDRTIPTPAVLVIGSEGKGIGPSLLAHCDLIVQLPMFGKVESLNAAVAGSVALFEVVRQSLQRASSG
jgi:23S rRNA (guanosine2251-2'-O)-methyltransferase